MSLRQDHQRAAGKTPPPRVKDYSPRLRGASGESARTGIEVEARRSEGETERKIDSAGDPLPISKKSLSRALGRGRWRDREERRASEAFDSMGV